MYRYLTLGTLLAFAAAAASARTVMIDNFEDPNSVAQLVVDSSQGSDDDTDTGLNGDNVIGGARKASLSAVWVLDPNEYVAMNINETSSGLCFITSSSTVSLAVDGYLEYGSFSGGSQLNADWVGLTDIIVDVDGCPGQDQGVDVLLWWCDNTPQEGHCSVSKTLTTSDSSLVFPLSEFTDLDPNDVDWIQVKFDVIPAVQSLAIEEIYAIPDPGSALILVAAGAWALMRRRGRR